MKDLLLSLLQAVLIAVTPILTAAICLYLKKKAAELGAKMKNTEGAAFLREATEAVCTAVTYTNQTYVDALKSQGTFSAENQKAALNKAKDKAVELLSAGAKDYIRETYGSLDEYIVTKIEAEVKDQKNGIIKVSAPAE